MPSKPYLTNEEHPFETPPAAAPQDKRVRRVGDRSEMGTPLNLLAKQVDGGAPGVAARARVLGPHALSELRFVPTLGCRGARNPPR